MPTVVYEPGSTIAALRPLFGQIKGVSCRAQKFISRDGSDRRYDFIYTFDQARRRSSAGWS